MSNKKAQRNSNRKISTENNFDEKKITDNRRISDNCETAKLNNNILIIGAGAHGLVVKETIESMETYEQISFLDDRALTTTDKNVIGKCDDYSKYAGEYRYAFPAIGNNVIRMAWIEKLEAAGFEVPVLIHKTAYVSPSAKISKGTIVEPKAVINSNVVVEEGCIISISTTLDHDCVIKKGTHIDCGAIVKSYIHIGTSEKVESGEVVKANIENNKKNLKNVKKQHSKMQSKTYNTLKRIVDITLATLGLIILSPVFLLLILAIKLDSPGPVLFKQKRIGVHCSNFFIYKFRTMRIDTPKDMPTHMLSNPDQYITRVGKFLRKTSLDELPQILNIIKGDMSIIGPRPALWNQYDLAYERAKYGANDIIPGLTGWAQINGRDELPIDVKAKLDGDYVKKIGVVMDIRCFFGTILSVLKHDGVVEGGTGEMEKRKMA